MLRLPREFSAATFRVVRSPNGPQWRDVAYWPIGEIAARVAEVRLAGYGGRDLLTLSSSRFDPERTVRGEAYADVVLVVFDQEKSAFFVAIEGIHSREQPLALDQPRLETFIHIKDEHQIFGFQIASDR